MIEYYLHEVEKPSKLLSLLKYIDTDEIDNEYWARIVDNVYNPDYLVIGIFRVRKCKTCIVKWKSEMIGFINIKWNQEDNEFDVLTLSLDVGCDNEVGNIMGKYLKSKAKMHGVKKIKFHSKIRPKEWYEEFLNSEFDKYGTYVLEV